MNNWIFAVVQFLPLSIFMGYAFAQGSPTDDRWLEAFQVGAIAAIVQLLIVLPQRKPANRLILAVNLYLMLGGLSAISRQYWLLQFYGVLKESAIFILILGIGFITTFSTSAGFTAVAGVPKNLARRASFQLLAITVFALAISVVFQGDHVLAGVVPMLCIVVLHQVLRYRLKSVKKGAQ